MQDIFAAMNKKQQTKFA